MLFFKKRCLKTLHFRLCSRQTRRLSRPDTFICTHFRALIHQSGAKCCVSEENKAAALKTQPQKWFVITTGEVHAVWTRALPPCHYTSVCPSSPRIVCIHVPVTVAFEHHLLCFLAWSQTKNAKKKQKKKNGEGGERGGRKGTAGEGTMKVSLCVQTDISLLKAKQICCVCVRIPAL